MRRVLRTNAPDGKLFPPIFPCDLLFSNPNGFVFPGSVLFDGTLYYPLLNAGVLSDGYTIVTVNTDATAADYTGSPVLGTAVGTMTIIGKTATIYGRAASGTYATDAMGGSAPIPQDMTGDFTWQVESEW
jgi:hypothetical protein